MASENSGDDEEETTVTSTLVTGDLASGNIEASISMPFKNFPLYDMAMPDGSTWPPNPINLGTPGRRSLAPDGGDYPLPSGHRASISRNHLVRPPSGLPSALLSPRQTGSDFRSSPRNSIVRPISASEQLVSGLRVRPASVDYSQQNKISAERSTSVLDRFVKIEDKDYFNSYVKVLPLDEGELWIPEDEADGENHNYILLLLHVQLCGGDVGKHLNAKDKYVVRVKRDDHLVLETAPATIEEGAGNIRWPMDKASFIKFVRAGAELKLELVNPKKPKTVLYETIFSTEPLKEKDGSIIRGTHPLRKGGDDNEMKLENFYLRTVCLPVMSSDYNTLQKKFKGNKRLSLSDLSLVSETKSMLHSNAAEVHIVAVKGLIHRIDASIVVYFTGESGVETIFLKTPHVAPKTRTPFWPADGAYFRIAQHGKLRFELQHKEHSIGSYTTTVDELVFGGAGIHKCALYAPQLQEPLGTLVLNTLSTTAHTKTENRKTDKTVFLHVRNVKLLAPENFIIPPDPFVVIRETSGAVVLRTPLVYSSFDATYRLVDGSCVLQCPTLEGSSFPYLIELCDNDISSIVGSATFEVRSDGIGPENVYLVEMGDVAKVEIYTQCCQVMDLNRQQTGPLPFNQNDPLSVVFLESVTLMPCPPIRERPADCT
ncbi:hypothetical protein AGDE_15065 [Angomonas deanei]|nr:hypothetical protein AGDE_15065 [Angomonas deanei]|eukprot:EPY19779.1 hypothetical protein AGDE_15065 [Angomonas deanei]